MVVCVRMCIVEGVVGLGGDSGSTPEVVDSIGTAEGVVDSMCCAGMVVLELLVSVGLVVWEGCTCLGLWSAM